MKIRNGLRRCVLDQIKSVKQKLQFYKVLIKENSRPGQNVILLLQTACN